MEKLADLGCDKEQAVATARSDPLLHRRPCLIWHKLTLAANRLFAPQPISDDISGHLSSCGVYMYNHRVPLG